MDTKKMMQNLWGATFGDRPEYVKLVFDTYFNADTVAYHLSNEGEIDSALLGMPYVFTAADGKKLCGLYLCGLATKLHARRKGYMTDLLEEINRKAETMGFDFTFLIPAGEGVRRYYADRGYHDSFYKIKENFVKNHVFSRQESLFIKRYSHEMNEEVIKALTALQRGGMKRKGAFGINHSVTDWNAVLKDTEIYETPVYIGEDKDEIVSVAFLSEEGSHIVIRDILSRDRDVELSMLQRLKETYPQSSITIIRDLETVVEREADSKQIWSPFFGSNNAPSAEYEEISQLEQPYNRALGAYPAGMIRILNIPSFLKKTGIDEAQAFISYDEEEIIEVLLRRPQGEEADNLERLLALPEISFSASLLLE